MFGTASVFMVLVFFMILGSIDSLNKRSEHMTDKQFKRSFTLRAWIYGTIMSILMVFATFNLVGEYMTEYEEKEVEENSEKQGAEAAMNDLKKTHYEILKSLGFKPKN